LLSRRGIFPLSYTLDHAGPLAWTVEDCAITMDTITAFDPLDPGSANVPKPDFRGGLGKGVEGLKIGLVRHWYEKAEGVSPETIGAIDDAAQGAGEARRRGRGDRSARLRAVQCLRASDHVLGGFLPSMSRTTRRGRSTTAC
jgi:Asp-tRNA(Asn)/Glu-tRNA(Gln) amidotransferase A subunit family amidase